MRGKVTVNSRDDLVRLIIERPVWAYLHMRTGLAEEIDENGADMVDAVKGIVKNAALLAVCIVVALYHFVLIAMYPIDKMRRLRNAQRELAPEYKRIIGQPTEQG